MKMHESSSRTDDSRFKAGCYSRAARHEIYRFLPHFRRVGEKQIDLLTFQFNRYGGSFAIEIAVCDVSGFTTHWGKFVPPNEVTAHDLHPQQRLRLGARSTTEDCWFIYQTDDSFLKLFSRISMKSDVFTKTASQVLSLMKSQAEPYWQKGGDLNNASKE